MNAQLFKNFTDEDFEWKYDGVVYKFKAGQEVYLEEYKAAHFSKHLIDRELTKANKRTNDAGARKELLVECFPGGGVYVDGEALDLNEKAKRKPRKKKVEPEFEDIKEKVEKKKPVKKNK